MEKLINNYDWVSCHIFYTSHNKLLIEAIPIFLDGAKRKFSIHKYFFIRYWELGPHIRLRLLVDAKDKDYIKKEIASFFGLYMEKNPTIRKVEKNHFMLNNTLQFIDYEPEVERYGGKEGIIVAESHFHDSSEIVLDIIQNMKNDWSLSLAQGISLQLAYIFIKGTSLEKYEIIEMITIMDNSYWKEKAKIISKTENIDALFENQYSKNKKNILAKIDILNSVIQNENQEENQSFLVHWFQMAKQVDSHLNNISLSRKKQFIYISYLHMLNNRLGLSNHDEGYIAFILSRIFKA